MWAICRINLLGSEILSIEVGHQQSQPQLTDDEPEAGQTHTGGTVHDFDRRPIEDVRDTRGWLPMGFSTRSSDV